MLTRFWKAIGWAALLLVLWVLFECWISWAAFCDYPSEYGSAYQAEQEYSCIFRGPLFSFGRFVVSWWSHTFDKADAYVALFTGVLAVSTLLLWVSTRNLWKAGRDQLELGRSEFLSTHRPQMRLKHLWFATYDGQRFFGRLIMNKPIVVRLDFVNTGNTTAFVRLINFITLLIPEHEELPQRPPYNEEGVQQFPIGDWPVGSGVTFTHPVSDGRILSGDDIITIRYKQRRLYFIGTIEYWWGTNRENVRQTAFCRYLHYDSCPAGEGDIGRFKVKDDPDYEFQD